MSSKLFTHYLRKVFIVNKCLFAGNLTRDPELRNAGGEKQVCSFGVALNDSYTNKAGEKVNAVEFIECEAWNSGGMVIAEHMKKGSGIIITDAKYKLDTWEKDGQKHSRAKFNVLRFEFPPGGKRQTEDAAAPAKPAKKGKQEAATDNKKEEEIPF